MARGQPIDVLVVGAGPAGLAQAVASAERGLSVALLAPDLGQKWIARYGSWRDELPDWVPVQAAWPRARVRLGPEEWATVDRAYVRVDAESLQEQLLTRAAAAGAHVARERVLSVACSPYAPCTVRATSSSWEARVVVDASGRGLGEAKLPPRAFQVAWGVEATYRGPALDERSILLMDLRDPHPDLDGPPSFLYAQPLGPERAFFEETVLATEADVPLEVLRARLYRRLTADGLEIVGEHEVERCVIPLDTPVPRRQPGVLPFGAAGGLVHPATGYQLARSLVSAPEVAEVLLASLRSGVSGAVAADRAWRHLWSPSRRLVRFAHLYGLGLLIQQDGAAQRRFFRSFFGLGPADVRAMLDGRSSPAAVAGLMLRMLRAGPMPLRRSLFSASALLRLGRTSPGASRPPLTSSPGIDLWRNS